MPIIEPQVEGYPLSQGDILRGITLHATKQSWNEKGGEAVRSPYKFCMVASRPCVIANKPHVTVVGVEKYSESTPKTIDSFGKALDFLTSARDGTTSPDVFYLGQIPSLEGRYCARLDSFHDIEIPAPSDLAARGAFTASRRVASLNPDFIRAFHTRLFGSFASMGFDDHAWLSTEDLKWLVTQGEADIARLEGELKQQEAQKLSREAEGKSFEEKQLRNVQKGLADIRALVEPYSKELGKRVPLPGAPAG